ncbi:TylF/MycF/NovP-related O-methyltransferase [Baekduia sp. Peel2402]|uniref:TylF/MycF/NovP-related O-methyltransferase n=1 Tax=Baekduia sp. Peel2402 TaxID=3458296 RepID=UPI00403E9502
MTSIRSRLTTGLARAGYELRRTPDPSRLEATHPDLERAFAADLAACVEFTMTSTERMYALWQAVAHVVRHEVPGDVVECGVWRGGSSMLAARALLGHGVRDRTLWLFDTFEGMSEPSERDVDALTGARMDAEWESHRGQADDPVFAFGSLAEVRRNMASVGYPADHVEFVQGKVEDTIPANGPERIALLRLDTDWYESTRHELEHFWDRLQPNGVLVIDDYGHWAGAREAVDEFFAGRADAPLLSRIDYTGRIGVKR